MADIKDVAKLAGVSISTVSNVMTGKKTVSPALEERVLKAVKELGYHASPIAQGMRNSRTNTIGVVISSFQRVFFGPMLKGIQDTVSEAGCVMNVLDSGGSLETEKRCVKYLVATKADGIIMESLAYDSDPKQEKVCKRGRMLWEIPESTFQWCSWSIRSAPPGWILSWWITAFPPEKR